MNVDGHAWWFGGFFNLYDEARLEKNFPRAAERNRLILADSASTINRLFKSYVVDKHFHQIRRQHRVVVENHEAVKAKGQHALQCKIHPAGKAEVPAAWRNFNFCMTAQGSLQIFQFCVIT